jgi:hypothetical protein
MEAFYALEVRDHFEQVPRLWVPAWAKHTHQTFRRPLCEAAQFLKSDRRVDIVAQYRFSRIEISGQETFDAFPEQLLPVFAVSLDPSLHSFLELSGKRHGHFSSAFRFL